MSQFEKFIVSPVSTVSPFESTSVISSYHPYQPYHPSNQPMSLCRITRITLPYHPNQPLSFRRITRITRTNLNRINLESTSNQPLSLYRINRINRINLCHRTYLCQLRTPVYQQHTFPNAHDQLSFRVHLQNFENDTVM